MCQDEVWGVFSTSVKVGVVCTVANCWVLGFDKVMRVELPRVLWGVVGFSYLCDVSWGWKFLMWGSMVCDE